MTALVCLLAAFLLATPAVAANRDGLIKVIVNFRGAQHLTGQQVRQTVSDASGTVSHRFRLINSAAAVIPADELVALGRNPNVKSVELDHEITLFHHDTNTGDAELEAAWGVEHIGSGFVHSAGNTGQGIKVGIIDTGIDYTHPDLDSRYAGGYDFFNNDADPFDDNGHGTHVAGILAAELNSPAAGVVGVAPGASLYSYKVLGADGSGDYSAMIAALERATLVDHVNVVNMSLGGTDPSQALQDAVAAAYQAGVILVAASGNVNPNTGQACPVAYPATYDQVFATTFTGPDNALTGYSCTGPQVDFAAPGDLINSTVPTGSCMFCAPSGYRGDLSGTSMASPHLAGAVALMLAHGITNGGDPATLADDVKAHLCANTMVGTGVTYFGFFHVGILPTDARYPEWFGCGVVDVYKALIVNPPPVTPTNQQPVATDDSASTDYQTAVTVDVLGNDTDADGDTLSVVSATTPANGTTAVVAGGVEYTPAAGFSGSDSFDYTVSDGHGGTDVGTVTVTVNAPPPPTNQPPTANDDSATTPQDTPVTVSVLANDTDPDADPVSVTSVTAPAYGSAAIVAGGVRYTPAAGFVGSDSFGYSISDGHGGTASATVAVTVTLPSGPTMHVGDLDNTSTLQKRAWTAQVRLRVHNLSHGNLSGVVVTGVFSNGVTRSCTTGSTGRCTVSVSGLSKTLLTSLTFTISSLAASGRTYTPSLNHDPDGDSNGTTIVVTKP